MSPATPWWYRAHSKKATSIYAETLTISLSMTLSSTALALIIATLIREMKYETKQYEGLIIQVWALHLSKEGKYKIQV